MRKFLLSVVVSHNANSFGVIVPMAFNTLRDATDDIVLNIAADYVSGIAGRIPVVSCRVEELTNGRIEHLYSTGHAFM